MVDFVGGYLNAIIQEAIKKTTQDSGGVGRWMPRTLPVHDCFQGVLRGSRVDGPLPARRIVEVICKWDANKKNDSEEFWQQVFAENTYILSQLFSVPIVFIKDKAFVGGMNIDRQDAKFVDYLCATESSKMRSLWKSKRRAPSFWVQDTGRALIARPASARLDRPGAGLSEGIGVKHQSHNRRNAAQDRCFQSKMSCYRRELLEEIKDSVKRKVFRALPRTCAMSRSSPTMSCSGKWKRWRPCST